MPTNSESNLNPTGASQLKPKSLFKQGTYRNKNNNMLKHWFTGKFNDEPNASYHEEEEESSLSTNEQHGMLNMIKELVISDLRSKETNQNANAGLHLAKASPEPSNFIKCASIRPQMWNDGNLMFAEEENQNAKEADSSFEEDYTANSDDEDNAEIIDHNDIKLIFTDDKQILRNDTEKIDNIVGEFIKTSSFISVAVPLNKRQNVAPSVSQYTAVISLGTLWHKTKATEKTEILKLNQPQIISSFPSKLPEMSKEPKSSDLWKDGENLLFPSVSKMQKCTTLLIPGFSAASEENKLLPQTKKKIIESDSHGKMIVLFASNLFWTNQFIDWVKVIEEVGLEYKIDKLSLANIQKLYCIIHLRDKNIDLALVYWSKALKNFRMCKSIRGTALCYLLKAFIQLDNQPDSSCWSLSEEDEDNKSNLDVKELLEKFDQKICSMKDDKLEHSYRKVRDLIVKHADGVQLFTAELIDSLQYFWLAPIFTTEDEKDEDFSPKPNRWKNESVKRKVEPKDSNKQRLDIFSKTGCVSKDWDMPESPAVPRKSPEIEEFSKQVTKKLESSFESDDDLSSECSQVDESESQKSCQNKNKNYQRMPEIKIIKTEENKLFKRVSKSKSMKKKFNYNPRFERSKHSSKWSQSSKKSIDLKISKSNLKPEKRHEISQEVLDVIIQGDPFWTKKFDENNISVNLLTHQSNSKSEQSHNKSLQLNSPKTLLNKRWITGVCAHLSEYRKIKLRKLRKLQELQKQNARPQIYMHNPIILASSSFLSGLLKIADPKPHHPSSHRPKPRHPSSRHARPRHANFRPKPSSSLATGSDEEKKSEGKRRKTASKGDA